MLTYPAHARLAGGQLPAGRPQQRAVRFAGLRFGTPAAGWLLPPPLPAQCSRLRDVVPWGRKVLCMQFPSRPLHIIQAAFLMPLHTAVTVHNYSGVSRLALNGARCH